MNLPIYNIINCFRCKIVPEVNQIEFNPYINDKDILDVCKDNDIIVQAYGPVGSGMKNTFVGGPQQGVSLHGKMNTNRHFTNLRIIFFWK